MNQFLKKFLKHIACLNSKCKMSSEAGFFAMIARRHSGFFIASKSFLKVFAFKDTCP